MTLTSEYARYINGEMPIQIIEHNAAEIYKRNYEYLGNGLIIINCDNNTPDSSIMGRYGRYLCYNEYYNDNIISEYKVNEFISLMEISSHDPDFTNTSFVITENNNEFTEFNKFNITVEYRYNRFQNGQNLTGIMLSMLVFDNETKRLTDLQVTNIQYPIIYAFVDEKDRVDIRTDNYEYTYDHSGRLENVYIKYNNEKILIKKYYYDGILRTFQKPYFNGIESPGLREIIIYDNQILKYHLKLFYGLHHYRVPETIDIRDSQYYYVIFEYDENKNEIQQTKYFGENNSIYSQYEYIIIYSNIQNIDEYGNWTKIIIHSDIEATTECIREIMYQ
jgi:hypothetical protein